MLKLELLNSDFAERVQLLQEDLICEGLDVLLYCGLRSCRDQAKIWRSSRTRAQIEAKIAKLESRGLDFLARIIRDVGPQYGTLGKHRTYAGPGESYHNYGLAADGVIMIGGKPDWEMGSPTAWELYGRLIEGRGLEWAGQWKRFREYVHFQLGKGSNPLKMYEAERIQWMLEEIGAI